MAPHDDGSPADIEALLADAIAAEERGPEALAAFLLGVDERQRDRLRCLLARLHNVPGPGMAWAPSGLPPRLGDFRLLRRVGGGGMGVVYYAEQVSLGLPAAVKVVRSDLLPLPGMRERFRREVEAAAAVRHNGVVPILAVGEQDGVPYFAMAWVDGRSAAEVLSELRDRRPGELDGGDLLAAIDLERRAAGGATAFAGSYWRACTALVLQVAEAIAHAHAHGVVHRDLKPGNVMFGADGRAVVLDFGLARMRGDVRLTRTGAGAGSPLYMSPEQHRGEATDERTDVYSLATTLAELLTLRPPFPADDVEQLRARVLAGQFTSLRAADRTLPRALEVVVHKAMDRDRRRRYADMRAFGDDLRRVLAGEPIAGRPLPLYLRAGRWVARHPALAGSLTVLAAVTVAVPAARFAERAHAATSIAEARDRAEREFGLSQRTLARLLDRFSSSTFLNTPGSDTVALPLHQDAVDGYRALLAEASGDARLHERLAQSLGNLAAAQARAGLVAAAEATFADSVAAYEWQQPPSQGARRAASLQRVLWGRLLLSHGRNTEARALCGRAATDLRDLHAANDDPAIAVQLADAWSILALIADAEGTTAEVERLYLAAYDLVRGCRTAHPGDRSLVVPVAKATTNLATMQQRHDCARASELFRDAADLLAAHDDEGIIDPQARTTLLATALAGLAYTLPHGEAVASEAAMRRSIGIVDQQVLAFPATPGYLHDLAAYEHNFGNLLEWWGRPFEALDWLQRAWQHEQQFLAVEPHHADGLRNANNHLIDRVRILQQLHRDDEAFAAAELWMQMPGPEAALAAARVFGAALQRAPTATDREARTARLFDLLAEAKRRGSATVDWQTCDAFRAVIDDPRFRAMLR
ncbi:MAG TPA: serine/threonine-protein kinase [Planctomycetota bacterium]|nr:serine/threonine-protein kinase [Planctomycetota bacterium]